MLDCKKLRSNPEDSQWEYEDDILESLYQKQSERRLIVKALLQEREKQGSSESMVPIVDGKNRAWVINKMVWIHKSEAMKAETLHISVAILDRGLLEMKVETRSQLYLLGITALFIACKYEEVD